MGKGERVCWVLAHISKCGKAGWELRGPSKMPGTVTLQGACISACWLHAWQFPDSDSGGLGMLLLDKPGWPVVKRNTRHPPVKGGEAPQP